MQKTTNQREILKVNLNVHILITNINMFQMSKKNLLGDTCFSLKPS